MFCAVLCALWRTLDVLASLTLAPRPRTVLGPTCSNSLPACQPAAGYAPGGAKAMLMIPMPEGVPATALPATALPAAAGSAGGVPRHVKATMAVPAGVVTGCEDGIISRSDSTWLA